MRTIAIANQKGGCGKTITAINLSAFLARENRRVLLIDMDPQGHATLGVLTDPVQPSKTMYDVFSRENGVQETRLRNIIRPAFENLDIAPADILLSAIPEKLAAVFGRENFLSEALDDVQERYDYVIVDCPPNVGLLTFNALKACSEAVIPMDPSFFSLHGIGKMLETLDMLARKTGHEIVARVLVTLYSGRSQFVKDVVSEIQKHLADRYFNTIIRHSIKLAEAASHSKPITHYCNRCVGFADYQAFAAEVIQQEAAILAAAALKADGAVTQASAPEGLAEPSAPTATQEGIMFALEAPDAGRVQLVGDFNDWQLSGNEMKQMGRVWKKVLQLQPGRYRYRYVVDGNWQSDPLNPEIEPAPYGGYNSIFILNGKSVE